MTQAHRSRLSHYTDLPEHELIPTMPRSCSNRGRRRDRQAVNQPIAKSIDTCVFGRVVQDAVTAPLVVPPLTFAVLR